MPYSDRLVAVAAHGLAGSRTDLPTAPLSEVEWFDLVQACAAADLVGFLAAAAAAGDLPVAPGQADELAVVEAERAGLTLLVERRALTLASLLAAAGIDHRLVDGAARRLAYGDSGVRHHRSVQLLVAADRLVEAVGLQGVAPTAGDGRRVASHERVVLRSSLPGLGPARAHLRPPDDADDLTTVAEIDLADRLGPAATVELAGRPVRVLTVEQQLVVACADATQTPVTPLVHLRDIAELALCPRLDEPAARRLAEATDAADALAEGIASAWNHFDLADKTELSVWARRMRASRVGRPTTGHHAPSGRGGFAQRVFGRVQPLSGATGDRLPSAATSTTAVPARSDRSTRRPR
jgi:hypothetical protein